MASIADISASGLYAQSQRLTASASNVANARSRGALPAADGSTPPDSTQAYQPVQTTQTALSQNGQPGGTRTTFTPITPAYLPEYAPDESFANQSGVVAAPNVDLASERINQISAAAAYKANVAALRTEDEMVKSLLDAKV